MNILNYEVMNETTVVLKPGTQISIRYKNSDDVRFIKVHKSETYDEREMNMMQVINNGKRVAYLDKVVEMYMSMEPRHRMDVMDQLEWTKYNSEIFVRDFISAVNNIYTKNHYNSKKKE